MLSKSPKAANRLVLAIELYERYLPATEPRSTPSPEGDKLYLANFTLAWAINAMTRRRLNMNTEILSLWRFPLDCVGISEAHRLADRQPRCSISYNENFGAMTIYNYAYYVEFVTPTAGLTAMLSAMSTASPIGGRGFIPQQSFAVNTSSSGFAVPDQCDIDGSGGGGALASTSGSSFFHFVITPVGPGNSIFFNCEVPAGGGTPAGACISVAWRSNGKKHLNQRTPASVRTFGTLK